PAPAMVASTRSPSQPTTAKEGSARELRRCVCPTIKGRAIRVSMMVNGTIPFNPNNTGRWAGFSSRMYLKPAHAAARSIGRVLQRGCCLLPAFLEIVEGRSSTMAMTILDKDFVIGDGPVVGAKQ